MRGPVLFSKYVAVLSDAAMVFIGLVTLTGHSGTASVVPPFFMLALISLVLFSADMMFVRRGVGVSIFTIINVIFLAAFLYVIISMTDLNGVGNGGKALLAVGVCICLTRIVYISLTAFSGVSRVVHLDVYIFFVVWYLLCIELGERQLSALPLMAAIFILNVVSVALLRAGGNSKSDVVSGPVLPGVGVYSGVIVAIFAAVFGLVKFFDAESSAIISGTVTALKAFFRTVGSIVEKIFLWLSARIKMPEESAVGEPQGGSTSSNVSLTDITVNPLAIKIIIGILVAAAAAVLVIFIVRNRSKKISLDLAGIVKGSPAGRKRIKGGFARWLEQILRRLKFRAAYLKNKNTPPGLLVWLENRSRRAGAPKANSETVHEFICRMDVSGILQDLSKALNAFYFGNLSHSLDRACCRKLKRDYVKAVRRTGPTRKNHLALRKK